MFRENISLALAGVRANKMRSLLTMLGIIIGIMAVIAILTLGDAMETFIMDNLSSMGANLIIVSVREKEDDTVELMGGMMQISSSTSMPLESDLMTDEDLKQMSELLSEIKSIAVYTSGPYGTAQNGRKTANISLYGVNVGFQDAQNIKIQAGRWLNDADLKNNKRVAIISENAVKNLYRNNDDAIGQEIKLNVEGSLQTYIVAGVYRYENQMMNSMMSEASMPTEVYVPNGLVKQDYSEYDGYSSFYIVGADGASIPDLTDKVNQYLTYIYRNNLKWEAHASNMETALETMTTIIGMVSLVIGAIGAISLLVGGIGVMNIMLVSVTERTREIGTRKAIGARNSSIRMQFIIESAILCGLGGIIGAALGVWLGWAASSALGFPTLASVGYILLSVAFSMMIGIFFGFYPANKASKLDPIEALRYE